MIGAADTLRGPDARPAGSSAAAERVPSGRADTKIIHGGDSFPTAFPPYIVKRKMQ